MTIDYKTDYYDLREKFFNFRCDISYEIGRIRSTLEMLEEEDTYTFEHAKERLQSILETIDSIFTCNNIKYS